MDWEQHVERELQRYRDGDTRLPGQADADVVAARLRDRSFADRSDAFWALRRLLERVASAMPLLLVLEDVHWAAPVLLDFVEYLTGWAEAPIAVVCQEST